MLAAFGVKADVVITDSTGSFSVGIGPDGELFDFNTLTGFVRLADGYDPLAPGTPRDTWGVYANGSGTYADQAYLSSLGLSSTYTSTASTAQYTTTTSNNLSVVQNYSFVLPNILMVSTSVTNSGSTPSDILFQRDVDWDIFPTENFEISSGPAISGNTLGIVDSSMYGFEFPDPSIPYFYSCAAGCNSQGDLGGGIKVDLGVVAPGGTAAFTYFYGINTIGETEASLRAQAGSVGAQYAIGTVSSDPSGSNSAFIGFGRVASTPEPASLLLLTTAIGGAGYMIQRRRRSRVPPKNS